MSIPTQRNNPRRPQPHTVDQCPAVSRVPRSACSPPRRPRAALLKQHLASRTIARLLMNPHHRIGGGAAWDHFAGSASGVSPFLGPFMPQLQGAQGVQPSPSPLASPPMEASGNLAPPMEASDISGPFVIDGEDDDRSSVATDDAVNVDALFPDKEFATFQDLRTSVEAFVSSSPFKMCDNGRSNPATNLPTRWLKQMFAQATSGTVKHSGHLYCSHQSAGCDEPLDCTWRVPYRLQKNGTWSVLKDRSCWNHNHDVSISARPPPSASGLVHLRTIDQLDQDHKALILQYLEAGLGIKRIRHLFRAKFLGFELRARVCKTMKTQYLTKTFGADRHQIDKLLHKLRTECNPAAGGVCSITHFENMEINEIYFQLPLLRAVGQYFGKFSVIDMTHNTTMYARNQATFNVSTLNARHLVSILNSILAADSRLARTHRALRWRVCQN